MVQISHFIGLTISASYMNSMVENGLGIRKQNISCIRPGIFFINPGLNSRIGIYGICRLFTSS
ncbi:MAG: hypothetical protein EA364_05760 [Balneolaceae bacterium]|nr:MAG: hypothetical protein EA364_05760 [Balneolaceae bacterium]